MASSRVLGNRYRIEEPPIGQGGMGVVYKAFDGVAKRYVAVKTLRGEVDQSSLELFQREWSVLAQLCHPNIVDVLDIGDYTEGTQQRPFFVMPYLPGATLDSLIKASGPRLTPERTIEIMSQACRGLQAAHDRGLIHRDLKPSNLFVMSDDTVKIIDFGIVHLTDTESRTGIKGTLQYMAPEQLEMKPASPRSDIFSLGVVCYEALTGRKPFERSTTEEAIEAIRSHMPAPASELNAAINDQVSRALHKAMAKQPYHRFSSAREFSDILQRSIRNEHIEQFERAKIQPRINRIKRALDEGDYQLAIDMLDELESEGNIDPEMALLRIKTEQATRSRAIYQLIESARTRVEEEEYPLALQNVQRVLDLDPTNVDALALKSSIERQRSASQIEKWLQIGRQHLDNKLFAKARQAAEEILKIDSANKPARDLLAEIHEAELELTKLRQERQQLYDAALKAYRNGEISSALTKLERVIELGKRAPGHRNTDAQYLAFYEQIRSERDELHNFYTEGKSALESRNFTRALEICKEVLRRRPGEPLFQALKIEIEDLQRQENSAAVAHLHSQIEAEADLDRKFALLKEAVKQFPDEQMFAQSLKLVKERRDLVNSIVDRARHYESHGLFSEASNQWDILRNVYSQYPGLDYEVQRISRKQEQSVLEEAKASLVERIDRSVFAGDYARAEELLEAALHEEPEDGELLRLQKQIKEMAQRSAQALALAEEGRRLAGAGDPAGAIQKLHGARELDGKDPAIASALCSALVEHARRLAGEDWRAAVPFVEEALGINSTDPGAASVSRLIEDVQKRERIEWYLMEARDLQTERKVGNALEKVEQGLREYPNEIRLSQLRSTLCTALEQQNAEQKRKPETVDAERTFWAAAAAGSETKAFSGFAEPTLRAEPQRDQPETLAATQLFSKDNAAQVSWLADEQPVMRQPEPVGAPQPVGYSARRLATLREEETSSGWPLRTKVALALAVLVVLSAIGLLVTRGRYVKHTPPAVVERPQTQAKVLPPPTQSSPQTKAPVDVPQPTRASEPTSPVTKETSTVAQAPRTGSVSFHFSTEPVPALVTVDDDEKLSCKTPCELTLRHGTHSVTLSAPNYEIKQTSVEVPDQTNLFQILSEELKAVRVNSAPTGATLTVDGEAKGQTPLTVRLPVGQHKITAAKDGVTVEKTINVTSDDLGILTIQLGSGGQAEKGSPQASQ